VGDRNGEKTGAGLLFGVSAYGLWGLMPIYFKQVQSVPGGELLAHRIIWCALLMLLVVTLLRGWSEFLSLVRSRRLACLLVLSSLLVATNWLIYIHGVSTRQVVQTSLGYFINPLFSVLLGIMFFRERLRPWQAVAVLLATVGVVHHVSALGEMPWIALGLAGSFGLYGLVRKLAAVEALAGLAVETLVLTPGALAFLAWRAAEGSLAFGSEGAMVDGLVLASGAVTAVPLVCFGAATRRLPLSTLGFLQYLAPSMQLALAVWLFDEPFTTEHAVSFGFIWAGLATFSVESFLARRRPDDAEAPAPVTAPEQA
jgi:chloramphenicol-sensitive protein RarD